MPGLTWDDEHLTCGNLPWRVMPREFGARCEDCGLAYHPEEVANG